MTIVVAGLSHYTAPLDLRDQLAITSGNLSHALEALRDVMGHGVILSTCNRSEVYTLAPSASQGVASIKQFLTTYHQMDGTEIGPHLYVHEERSAVHHLFRVACGLDSLILGETQVLGQVRDAYSAASSMGMARGILARLFHQALRVGKRARSETGISRNALSVSRAAVEMARRTVGDLRWKRTLLIGVGDAGKQAARALADAGATEITVTNRTYQRAEELAGELGGRAIPFDDLSEALATADIVVSATGSPGYIVTPEMVTTSRPADDRPVFLIDLAVPRDIDPAVKALNGVHLYDLDDLETVAETNRRQRKREAQKVKTIVEHDVDRFMEWLHSQDVVPVVAALQERAENIQAQELAKLMEHLPHLTDGERQRLTAFSRAMVKKLLHQPIVSLKEKRDPALLQAARGLFGLE